MATVGEPAFGKKLPLSGKISWLLWTKTCFDLVPSFQYILKVHNIRSAGVKSCRWLVWFCTKPQQLWSYLVHEYYWSTLKRTLKSMGKLVSMDTKAWRKSSYRSHKLFRSITVTLIWRSCYKLKQRLHRISVTLSICILSITLNTTKEIYFNISGNVCPIMNENLPIPHPPFLEECVCCCWNRKVT